ncbi:unnamed protein product [Paramecium sonneborni]|uniref:Protein kinase domain-containing protein n=1 Tax=Paramecium sonneborni TaxID=65129 RepID=A0A8S1MVU8_9CILI|nr:unnamed protein product [Paramecium sonneborni]
MYKQLNDFLIKEQLFSYKKRAYYNAIKLHPENGENVQYMCQIISKPPINPSIEQNFKKLCNISNRNVIQYIDFKESPKNYQIFMEQINQGNLDEIMNNTNIDEDTAKCYFRQILNGLKSLHENQITFIDLNPQNIFKSNDEIKIGQINIFIDEIANMENDQDFNDYQIVKEIIPPEILQYQTQASMVSDLYSVSVIYFKLIYKRYPFNGSTKEELIQNIKKNNIDFSNNDKIISNESIDFLQKTLRFEPNERLNWSQVYQHPLLQLLKINKNSIAQSTLLSISMNQLISKSDLLPKVFDCEKNRQFYQDIEQKSISTIHKNNTQTIQKQKSQNEDLDQFDKQLSIAKDLFKEQRIKLLQKQLDYYIEQRNIYSSLSQSLSYVRLFNNEFHSATLEFLILKLIFLISKQLIQQIYEIKLAAQFEQCLCQDLQEKYDNFQKKIDEEYKIIDSQFSKALYQAQIYLEKSQKKANFDGRLWGIINRTTQYSIFEFLRDQTRTFIQSIPTFKVILSDIKIQYQIIIQILFSLALVVSYLLKQNPIQILKKSPIEYEQYIRTQSTETLIEEYKEKQKCIEQAFDKVSKICIQQI